MTYKGHVRDGVIVLDGPLELPEGAEVAVSFSEQHAESTWADRLKGVIGMVDDLPADMAEQHDHYLHAAPKR
jgi:hypothetical protein